MPFFPRFENAKKQLGAERHQNWQLDLGRPRLPRRQEKSPRHMGSNGVKSYQIKLSELPKFEVPNFDFAICFKNTLVRCSVFFCTKLYLLLLAKHRFVIRLAPALANWIVHPAQKAHRVVQARHTVVLEEILHQVIGATSHKKLPALSKLGTSVRLFFFGATFRWDSWAMVVGYGPSYIPV